MKIAWFTPFRKASAIGRFSMSVTACLAATAEVDLWLAEDESAELHPTKLRIIRYSHMQGIERFLAEYDFVFYNMGDHFPFHGPIYAVSRVTPGIIILHDYVMHHFFLGYCDQRTGGWEAYSRMMARWYGADIKPGNGWPDAPWRVWERDEEIFRYPLFEQAIEGSLAVITHSDFVRRRVAEVRPGPVRKFHLGYEIENGAVTLTRADLNVAQDKILAVTIGNVNANKRVEQVLHALASEPGIARNMTYVVIGSCERPFDDRLKALHRDLNLGETVRFTGYANDEIMRAYLNHADFCVNLRWPAMESGSASCAEQMLFGKPAIVTDTGVYHELPEDCVLKVRPEHEQADLVRHIRELSTNERLRLDMGRRAREFAMAEFNPAVYAGQLFDFCEEVSGYRPAFALVDMVAKELSGLGVTTEMAIVDKVAREGALLLGGDYDPPILRDRNPAAKR